METILAGIAGSLLMVCGVLVWHCRRLSKQVSAAKVETKGLVDAYNTVAWACEKLEVENGLRREYAYVCEVCRAHRDFGGGGQRPQQRSDQRSQRLRSAVNE